MDTQPKTVREERCARDRVKRLVKTHRCDIDGEGLADFWVLVSVFRDLVGTLETEELQAVMIAAEETRHRSPEGQARLNHYLKKNHVLA